MILLQIGITKYTLKESQFRNVQEGPALGRIFLHSCQQWMQPANQRACTINSDQWEKSFLKNYMQPPGPILTNEKRLRKKICHQQMNPTKRRAFTFHFYQWNKSIYSYAELHSWKHWIHPANHRDFTFFKFWPIKKELSIVIITKYASIKIVLLEEEIVWTSRSTFFSYCSQNRI
jgi:hypothetical protein